MAAIDVIIRAKDQASAVLKKVTGGISGMGTASKKSAINLTELNSGIQIAGRVLDTLDKAYDQTIGKTVAYGREVRDLSTAWQTSEEEASALIQIADDLMISTESLGVGFRQLTRDGTQPTIENIKALADEYKRLPTPIAKSQFAIEKFGSRAGPQLQKMLEQSSYSIDQLAQSAKDAGLIMDGEAVDAAIKFERELDNLNDAAEGLKIQIGSGLLPAATEFVKLLSGPSADQAANFLNAVFQGTWLESEASRVLREAAQAGKEASDAFSDVGTNSRYAASGTEELTEAEYESKAASDLVSSSLSELTVEMLYNKAAAGLDAEAALELGRSMGVINEETYAALSALQALRDKYDANRDGAIDAAEAAAGYTEEAKKLGEAIAALQSKEVTITTNRIDNYISTSGTKGGSGYTGVKPEERAVGGPVNAGEPYLVGEKGPELVIPGQSGTVISNDKLDGVGGTTINIIGWQGDAMSLAREVQRQQQIKGFLA